MIERALADALAGTFPPCEDAAPARALLRELAKGRPVTAIDAARRWPNVELDAHGRVVAFGGLSLTPTAHRFVVGSRPLFTWCAWDTLFLPALLAEPAEVESACPITGSPVRLTVEPAGVRDAEPDRLRVSFPAPAATSPADIRRSFCRHVHFLAGPEAAERWRSRHAGTVLLTLDEAFELGRLATRCCGA